VGDGYDKSFIEARMLEVFQWCGGTDAKTSAKRLLRKYRLPLDGEDLLADAQAAAVQATADPRSSSRSTLLATACGSWRTW
jgi:hypothetical protein